jgi:hypothetical protein
MFNCLAGCWPSPHHQIPHERSSKAKKKKQEVKQLLTVLDDPKLTDRRGSKYKHDFFDKILAANTVGP